MKKSFLVYHDQGDVFEALSNEDAGKLIKAIFDLAHGVETNNLNPILKMALIPIRKQLSRDLEKYNSICNRNKKNGLLGGRPRNPKNPVGTLVTQNNPEKPKKPDNDTDNDTDNDNDKEINKYISLFNSLFNSKYTKTAGRVKKLNARLKSFELHQILTATKNLGASKFHLGENDRSWKADPDFLLRSDEQIDKWINQGPAIEKKSSNRKFIELKGHYEQF